MVGRNIKRIKAILFSRVGTRIIAKATMNGTEKLPAVGSAITALKSGEEQIQIEDRRQKALDRLFGTSDPIYLVGADNHPYVPLVPGELVYPSERIAAQKLKTDFFKGMQFEETTDYVFTKTIGSQILLGSSIANRVSRNYLGEPKNPRMCINNTEYETELYYNYIWSNVDVTAKKMVEGRPEPLLEHNWGIATRHDELFPRTERGWLKTDLLLVTRIPSGVRGGGDVLIFGGAQGPGTQATELLIRQLDWGDLKKIVTEVGDSAHFQALFLITDISHDTGHSFGEHIEYIKAYPLHIEWKRHI